MADLMEMVRQGKVRRVFRARRKLDYPGLISHVTQRATGREPLFLEESDCLFFLRLLKESSIEHQLDVLAFVLMPNHIHILLRQNQKNLSQSAYRLFRLYALGFNKKYGRKGHVFCDRFRQAACFDYRYLIAASVYIHLNPVRAGLTDHFSRYRWSSWRLYCRPVDRPTFISWKMILELIDRDDRAARERYRGLLDAGMRYRGKDALEDNRAVGKFTAWLRRKHPGLWRFRSEGKRQAGTFPDLMEGSGELEAAIDIFRAKQRLRHPRDIQARRFAVEQLRARGFTAGEIADYLNLSRSTVFRILSGLERERNATNSSR